MVRIQAVIQTVVEQYGEGGEMVNRQQLQAVDVTAMSTGAWLTAWGAAGQAVVEALTPAREAPEEG